MAIRFEDFTDLLPTDVCRELDRYATVRSVAGYRDALERLSVSDPEVAEGLADSLAAATLKVIGGGYPHAQDLALCVEGVLPEKYRRQ